MSSFKVVMLSALLRMVTCAVRKFPWPTCHTCKSWRLTTPSTAFKALRRFSGSMESGKDMSTWDTMDLVVPTVVNITMIVKRSVQPGST